MSTKYTIPLAKYDKSDPYTATLEEIQEAHLKESLYMVVPQRGILLNLIEDLTIELVLLKDFLEQSGIDTKDLLD